MKNIHVLPTDKPSRLIIYSTLANEFRLLDEPIEDWKHKKNIYITNSEEIKEEDYGILGKEVLSYHQMHKRWGMPQGLKIILTTDQDLIKDGVQAIDDELLKWFVKNPSCDEVEVKKEYITPLGDIVETCYDNERLNYKIIIPKEEAKQDEIDFMANELVIEKERMYSEEDLIDAFNEGQSLNIRGNYFPSREKDIWYSVFELNSCISLQNTFTTKKLLEIFKKIKK